MQKIARREMQFKFNEMQELTKLTSPFEYASIESIDTRKMSIQSILPYRTLVGTSRADEDLHNTSF